MFACADGFWDEIKDSVGAEEKRKEAATLMNKAMDKEYKLKVIREIFVGSLCGTLDFHADGVLDTERALIRRTTGKGGTTCRGYGAEH